MKMCRSNGLALATAALCGISLQAQDGNLDAPKPPVATRAPEPDASAQKEAERQVRDIFKAEYARKAPAAQQALARRLLEKGTETRDDATAAFVMLREAREIAAQAGDVDTALAAVDALAKSFAVEPVPLKTSVLVTAARAAKTPDAAREVAAACLGLVDDAVGADDYDSAAALAARAEASAKSAQDAALASEAQATAKEVAEGQREYLKVKVADKVLQEKPEDPAALLVIGRYLCLVKGRWDLGLSMLATGSDAALRILAQKELAKPAEPAGLVELGDGWWDAAEKEHAAGARARMRGRAKRWYEEALPKLAGLTKVKVEKRLEEPDGPGGSRTVDLLRLIDPKKDGLRGTWVFDGPALLTPTDAGARLQIPYEPPDEYILDVVAERKGRPEVLYFALPAGPKALGVEVDGWGGTATVLALIDGRGHYGNPNETLVKTQLFSTNKPGAVRVTVRKTKVTVAFDGRTIIDWKADYNRVSMSNIFGMNDPKALGIGGWNSSYRITRIAVTPLSGPGKKLR